MPLLANRWLRKNLGSIYVERAQTIETASRQYASRREIEASIDNRAVSWREDEERSRYVVKSKSNR